MLEGAISSLTLGLLVGLAVAEAGGLGGQVAGLSFDQGGKFSLLIVIRFAPSVSAMAALQLRLNRLANSYALRWVGRISDLTKSALR